MTRVGLDSGCFLVGEHGIFEALYSCQEVCSLRPVLVSLLLDPLPD